MKLKRRGFIKGLASLALLPSLAWARLDRLEAPKSSLVSTIDVYVSDYGEFRIQGPRFGPKIVTIPHAEFAAKYLRLGGP